MTALELEENIGTKLKGYKQKIQKELVYLLVTKHAE